MPMAPPPPPFAQVVDDLIKGQQFATQLQDLLRASPKAGLIMDQILHTFSRAIHAAEAAAATSAGEWSSDVQSEVTDAGNGGGKRKSAAGGGDRRACRRKTQQSSVVTKNLKSLDDGLAWRKYGQKEIQNCKHPKAYFRCTHKFDQLCKAQRQVQLCDDDTGTYKVTYIGVHTCQDPATAAVTPHHQTGSSDVLHAAGYHYISFAPNAVAAPATTTSTTTTVTVNTTTNHLTGMDAAAGSGLQSLKLGSRDQEEVLSSNTPGNSALRSTAGAATAPSWLDQGDVTSTLQYGGDVDLGDQFLHGDFAYLDDIVPYYF
uniref:Uncharacterized protein n=1 Tax=Avena sativa TaxID=4498 RepID=A0ACD5TQ63_AVESA